MDAPGEKLLVRMWETLTEKGIGGLLRPWQSKREARALLEVRCEEQLVLAQVEKDIEDIRSGRKKLRKDGSALTVESIDSDDCETSILLHASGVDRLGLVLQQVVTESMIADVLRREVNVAKAVLQAETSLEGDTTEPPTGKIDDDWLYRWRDFASQVSTERLQSLWGSLLAGEIKSPGRFTLRTLDFLRNLSQEEATDIDLLMRYTLNDWIIRGIDYWDDRFEGILTEAGLSFGFLCRMQELGVIAGVESGHGFVQKIESASDSHFIHALISHEKMLAISHKDVKKQLQVHGYALTLIGMQLARLGVFRSDESYVRSVGETLAENGYQVLLTDPAVFEYECESLEDGSVFVPGETIQPPKRGNDKSADGAEAGL